MTFAFAVGDLAVLRRALGGPFSVGVEVEVEARRWGSVVGKRYRVRKTSMTTCVDSARAWANEADLEPGVMMPEGGG